MLGLAPDTIAASGALEALLANQQGRRAAQTRNYRISHRPDIRMPADQEKISA
jgi:hypothetical protein